MTAPPMPPIQNNKKVVRNSKRQPSYTELAFLRKRPLLASADLFPSCKLMPLEIQRKLCRESQDSEQWQRENSEEVFEGTVESRV
jgi:hypothetical protein